jgi:hypothetical protein
MMTNKVDPANSDWSGDWSQKPMDPPSKYPTAEEMCRDMDSANLDNIMERIRLNKDSGYIIMHIPPKSTREELKKLNYRISRVSMTQVMITWDKTTRCDDWYELFTDSCCCCCYYTGEECGECLSEWNDGCKEWIFKVILCCCCCCMKQEEERLYP